MFSIKDYLSDERLKEFCKKNYIIKLSVFGSALSGKLRDDSDIDILVEFDKDHIPSLLDLAGMEIELSNIIGRKVDLRTPQELSKYFREEVIKKAKVEYAAER